VSKASVPVLPASTGRPRCSAAVVGDSRYAGAPMTPDSSSEPVVPLLPLSASCLNRSRASSSVGRPALLYIEGPTEPPGSASMAAG
jgi:hypothetical protein